MSELLQQRIELGGEREVLTVQGLLYDLRTPLNQIIGYSELLMEMVDEHQVEALLAPLRLVHRAAMTLAARLQEEMAPWKIEAGKFKIEKLREKMLPAITQIETLCGRCEEMALAESATLAQADLGKIRTATERLHRKLGATLLEQSTPDPFGIGRYAESASSQSPAESSGVDRDQPHAVGRLLVVDDDRINREMIGRRLRHMGFKVAVAEDGMAALEKIREQEFDLVLLDVMMPKLDGFATLDRIKSNPKWAHIPVIMLSALDDPDTTARCITAGAEDYVPKPFKSVVLRARIESSLLKKKLHDQELDFLSRIQQEQAKSEALLLGILPAPVAARLKAGERDIVDLVPAATVLFADIVGFTNIASTITPNETVILLNELFSAFDRLVEEHGLEKIKTIGDAYMAVAGVPEPVADHALRGARMALAMQEAVEEFNEENALDWSIRVGVHCGPLMAGIIGSRKFAYDLWGDTVNLASRLESQGEAGKIHVSETMAASLKHAFTLTDIGIIPIRNRGDESVFRLEGER